MAHCFSDYITDQNDSDENACEQCGRIMKWRYGSGWSCDECEEEREYREQQFENQSNDYEP